MKRILCILLCVLLLGMVPVMSYATDGNSCGESLTWSLDANGTLTISGSGDMWNWSEEGAPWYPRSDYITEVIIGPGVTSIGEYAFSGCTWIREATIADDVTRIGFGAFMNCANLTEMELPKGVTVVEEYSFFGCTSLRSVMLGSDVREIKGSAFYGCNGLEEVWIPKSVSKIGALAFYPMVIQDVYFEGSEDAWKQLGFNAPKATQMHDSCKNPLTHWTPYCAGECCICGYSRVSENNPGTGDHVYDQKVAEERFKATDATCQKPAAYYISCFCGAKGGQTFEAGDVKDHSYATIVTEPTCTAQGYTTHICACGDQYVDSYVDKLGHDMGDWKLIAEATPFGDGQERSDCTRCEHHEDRSFAYTGNGLRLEGEDLLRQNEVWVDGRAYAVQGQGSARYVELPTEEDCILITYAYHVGDANDIHSQYPTGMKVYKVSHKKVTHIPELDNLLQYVGMSIRVTGSKGIRMITALTKNNKAALTGNGLEGYKLLEYGTVLCWSSELDGGKPLVLGQSYAKSNFAYKKGVADPVFDTSGDLTQYTNVLVGFYPDQCKDDIAMRPYIILEDGTGKQVTMYGGIVYRSIGYVAYQNRNVFQPGTAAYDYVWDIIHHVYGNRYDG